MDARTVSGLFPCGITGKIFRKSPPRSIVLP
ncbi:BnaCnng72150D, partial [Brassica napus]